MFVKVFSSAHVLFWLFYAKKLPLHLQIFHFFYTMKIMSDITAFFRGFLRNPLQVSSVVPTSKKTITHLVDRVHRGRSIIVEYGSGTGVLAKALLASGKLSPDSMLILIEKSDVFAAHLTTVLTDSRVHVFCDSAENVLDILRSSGETEVDYIFSSIPFSIMPKSVVIRILKASQQILADEGKFIILLASLKTIKLISTFFSIRTTLEIANIPPLIVIEATKKTTQ